MLSVINISYNKKAQSNIPEYFRDHSAPSISYTYTSSISAPTTREHCRSLSWKRNFTTVMYCVEDYAHCWTKREDIDILSDKDFESERFKGSVFTDPNVFSV